MTTPSLIEQNRVQIKEVVRFPWNKPEGLPKIVTGQPLTSIAYSGKAAPEPIIAPYRFHVSATGNKIIILSNDPMYTADYSSNLDFLVYDIENKKPGSTSAPMGDDPIDKAEVVDFLSGENNGLYLLERLSTKDKTTINRLRRIEAGGKIVWETKATVGTDNAGQKGLLFGKCTALLAR